MVCRARGGGRPLAFVATACRIACICGLWVLRRHYFVEGRVGRDYPPPITHPEHFYGFIGVAVAWQVLFLLVATDPRRYRLVMLPAIIEKLTYGCAVIVLFLQHRVAPVVLLFACVDLCLGALFYVSFRRTPVDGRR
mgnify:CR=1 FL=1